jgi:hypothetical protein
MEIAVVGAGVGRTGTHSLKLALEQLLGGPCHHMTEVLGHADQVPAWIDVVDGGTPDWPTMLAGYRAIVDWPGCSFWPELAAAYPEALVLLSVRDPESWYRSASNTIFLAFDRVPPHLAPWMVAFRRLLGRTFSDQLDDPTAMMDAFVRHNEAVRAGIPARRLLEWSLGDGWEPICERLELPVPAEPFPVTNSTGEFREMVGLDPLP